MKKEYIQPKIKAINVGSLSMLCGSLATLNYRGDDYYSGDEGIDVD
ncbi:MAG: hypothetical protein KBS65_04775 [Prevotella sp.]|nr:hypothetical protein [Candidatus Equicola stercoris]